MTNPTSRSAHPITRFILRATESEGAAHTHLDENDLALLEMDALSEQEQVALRRILSSCQMCRTLASQVLKEIPSKVVEREFARAISAS